MLCAVLLLGNVEPSAGSEVAGAGRCLARNRAVFLNEMCALFFLQTDCWVFVEVSLEAAGGGAGLSSSEWMDTVAAASEVTQISSSFCSYHLVLHSGLWWQTRKGLEGIRADTRLVRV